MNGDRVAGALHRIPETLHAGCASGQLFRAADISDPFVTFIDDMFSAFVKCPSVINPKPLVAEQRRLSQQLDVRRHLQDSRRIGMRFCARDQNDPGDVDACEFLDVAKLVHSVVIGFTQGQLVIR